MRTRAGRVFINVPFDAKYERLYVALVAGLVALGYVPHAALEVPATVDRLRRIFDLLQSCEHSIHDLSRVQLDGNSPRCPRFNMPFEAGLAFALSLRDKNHGCAIFEAKEFRLQKTLSDLNGIDPYIHNGTIKGVMISLADFAESGGVKANIDALVSLNKQVSQLAQDIKLQNGSLFRPNSYRQLVAVSQDVAIAEGYIPG